MENKESKHDRFRRIATKRVKNVIKRIESIGVLSTSGYEYTDEEIEKIFSALQETLDNVKASFFAQKSKTEDFEL